MLHEAILPLDSVEGIGLPNVLNPPQEHVRIAPPRRHGDCCKETTPIKSKFENEASNHNRFTEDRLMNASIPLKPENALQVGLKKAVKNPDLMSIFKKNWGAPPQNFKTAINWKAFDYWHFANYSTWPEDGKTYGPLNEQLSMPRHGVV